jgi:hypothetical protein
MRYDLHIEHTYPNFTIKNCESCHNPGMFNVPGQAKSLPDLNSGTDDVTDRELGTVPAFVTGPASRACGGCHRADSIKEDDPDELRAFNQHTRAGGYLIDNAPGLLDSVIKTIMGIINN